MEFGCDVMNSDQEYLDPCEWNPEKNRASYYDETHAQAKVILGANGTWRLCEECAKLPYFKHYRVRRKIKPSEVVTIGDENGK